MRIALTGVSGLVGWDLYQYLEQQGHEVWALGRTYPAVVPQDKWRVLDILDPVAVDKTVTQINPDCLIHSAAMSGPDECELNADMAYKVNALATRNLALACQRFDTEMVYVSTDQVFDGKKAGAYHEMDAVNAVNHYGRSKIWAEQFVQQLLRRFYIVRTSLVFGSRRATFIDKVVRAASQQDRVVAATDLINSSTHVRDFSKAIAHLVTQHLYGIYHIAGEGYCTRYELACFVAKVLGVSNSFIVQGSAKDLTLPAKRPGATPLENKVWNLNAFPKIRTWQESVTSYIQQEISF